MVCLALAGTNGFASCRAGVERGAAALISESVLFHALGTWGLDTTESGG